MAMSSLTSNKIIVTNATSNSQPQATNMAVPPIIVSAKVSSPSNVSLTPSNTSLTSSTIQTVVPTSPTNKIIVSNLNQSPQLPYKALSPVTMTNKTPLTTNVIITSPNSNVIVPSSSIQTVLSSSSTNKIIVSNANQLQTSYKARLPSSNAVLTSSGTNIVLPSAKLQTPISSSLSSNIIVSNANQSVTNKLVDSSSIINTAVISTSMSNMGNASSEMEVDANDHNTSKEILKTTENVAETVVNTEASTDGCSLKFEPKHSNIGVVGGRYVILQQLPGNKFSIQEPDPNNKSVVNTIILQNSQNLNFENKNVLKESPYKEATGSLLKATLLGTDHVKEQNVIALNPMTHEVSNAECIESSTKDALIKSDQNTVALSPEDQHRDSIKQIVNRVDSMEKLANANGDSTKKSLNLRQLQHEIALMKARQNIALQVEREVLRAKDVKFVREVLIPARKALLSDVGSQTNLFSLVEPGRMVEMMLNSDKTSATAGMVSSKGKLGSGENSSGIHSESGQPLNVATATKSLVAASDKITNNILKSAGEKNVQSVDGNAHLEGPDKKRPRLDESYAGADVRTTVSDGSVDFGMDISSEEHRNSVVSKNINVLALNSNLVQKPNMQLKGSLGQQQIIYKVMKQRVENTTPKSVFDIIVQHNIAAQAKIPSTLEGPVPMVYIPESNSFRKNSNTLNMNIGNPMIPLPQNVNLEETAARIYELKLQAFGDWSRCLSPDGNGDIPLHKAVICENMTLIKRQCVVLYARKASLDVPNNEKKTPLHLAVDFGNAEIVRMLLNFGAQSSVKDYDGNTALHLAVMDGNYECVEAILNCSNPSSLPLDDFNDEGYAPMHLCALRGKVEETKLLLNKGAEVNLKDARSGRTPLFHAVEANSGELVRLLLAADANTNEPNFAGHTPLTAASEISFSTRPNVKDIGVTDGMNFNSKLVSLKSGEDISQILEGSNILIRGDTLEDISMDEGGAECYNKTSKSVSSSNVWPEDV